MPLTGNGNFPVHESRHYRPDVIYMPFRFRGAGAAAPVDLDAAQRGTLIASITRNGAGLYTVEPARKMLGDLIEMKYGVIGGTAGHIYDIVSLNFATPTFQMRVVDAAAAAADLANNAILIWTFGFRSRTRR